MTFVLDESHPSLSWQIHVARRLAGRVAALTVLTSRVGDVGPVPGNMEIVVPPKRPLGIPLRYGGRWSLNREIFKLCRSRGVDAMFVHMAKDWAYQLKPATSLLGIPVVLWYAHGSVSTRLRAAVWSANRVVTSTPDGCRLASRKIKVIGQAIDTDLFAPPDVRRLRDVLYVGRVSRRKRVALIHRVARALESVDMGDQRPRFVIVGSARTMEDLDYERGLRNEIWRDGMEQAVTMVGHVPHARIPVFYEDAFVHLNVSETGSMDKTVMEALAAGCPVLTSNPAFRETLRDYPEFLIDDSRPEAIAERISHIHSRRRDYDPQVLRALVRERHALDSYADRVLQVIGDVVSG